MAPVVRISEESYERLKSWAEPLEDTAEDALRKALDAADQQRNRREQQQTSIQDSPLANATDVKAIADVKIEAIPEQPVITSDDTVATAERMFVSLPEEFRTLAEGQGKMRGRIARKAYLDRIGVSTVRPGQWVSTTGGRMHYLGYSAQNSPGLWFFGASQELVDLAEKYLADNSLASFVFLCGLSEDMIVAVPVDIPQLEQMVGLGLFSKSGGQLKFNIRREAGDVFYLDGRLME